jgi:hypothetical protein
MESDKIITNTYGKYFGNSVPKNTLDDYVKSSETIEDCESQIRKIDSGEIKVTYSFGGSNQLLTDRVREAYADRINELKNKQ